MENPNFSRLISLIEQNLEFLSELPRLEQQYLVKVYKITELKPASVAELYSTMQKKFYLHRRTSNEASWYENELRIFIWLLFGYLFVFQKQLDQLDDEDWKFFSPVFNFKSTVFFEFQSLFLLRPSSKPTLWTEDETALLQTIISQTAHKNRWNSIARELFIRSGKSFFRNPKQCRERWINYLDPSKIHSEWTASEDFTLLSCIRKKGKRWSLAMKELSNTRTEHMVKNRYKSLLFNQCKKYPAKKEAEVENILLKKIGKILQKQSKSPYRSPEKGETEEKTEKLQPIFRLQMKEERVQTPLQDSKMVVKEDLLRLEDEQNSFNFRERLGSDFNEFEVNSPMFIPWHEEGGSHRFDIGEDGSRNSRFCDPIDPYSLEELSF